MEAKGTVTPAGALRSLREFYPDFEGPSQQDCAEMIGAVIGAIEDEGRINVDVETLLASFRKDTTTFSSETNRKPTVPGHSGRREPFNGSTAKEERKKSDYEYSLPEVSPEEPNDAATTHSEMFGEKTQSDIKMFEMMHTLNEKNAVLEKKSQERRGLPLAKRSAFVPPNIFFNSTTDGFKGYLMSEVLCHRCGATSGTIESFTALLLDIPTHAQRTAFAKNHPEIQRCLPNGQPLQQKKPTLGRWYNPLSWLSYLYSLFRYACSSLPPLTLEECLDIHFEPLKLSGSSKYHCESCGEVSDATKKVSILSLPEYLLFHMKRFDAGLCFDTKKTDSVSFPISWNPLPRDAPVNSKSQPEVLDLRHYLHPALAEDVALPPEGFRTSRDSTPGSANGPKHSSYTLSGVVTHSGSLSGGHYVASVFKKTDTQSSWVHISDDAISGSTATEVSQMEDYVLLYQKQPIMELSEEDLMLRDKARYYLSRAAQGAPDGSVYISRMWLHRMAFFTDPGPILNQLCYCNEEKRKATGEAP
ncbi:ubiquitin carboxyl-terminal hydrolase 20/33 [Angomonas deanei]|uniref:Ubiquitin carboxyl-terminal hydrolase, putative n=1 Tax=Angomonas deanei TaxID=59799 RepID=A0A7G2CKY8_9TRYP|nr:ubiquitin carboxyl-terminal hydrolase 20/33 [Angomonas deanei]CAD2220528.1 Ubiquitin carboxyl-terminal hydrolase, putative [Angomonas deanei]|eukprot:EPY21707.1 ubiquitin carboxyl-terminal hydrolase 20/33 [Angomonas deanei]